jgi:hypothetical protein
VRPRQRIASAKTQGTGRIFGDGDTRRALRACVFRAAAQASLAAFATCSIALAAPNPFAMIGETFSDWKDRLFGKPKPMLEAPAEGAIALKPDHPTRFRIDKAAPEREFPKGKSRYRIVELPEDFDHAAVRVQITALPRENAFGHEVFKPFLYTLNADDTVRDTVEVKPLHLDIRPFRRTRLLGCATLDKVGRFAIATEPAVVGKSYESEVRDSIKAPTQGGFYYATDAVKVKLPYAETGELTLEVTKEPAAGKGC